MGSDDQTFKDLAEIESNIETLKTYKLYVLIRR